MFSFDNLEIQKLNIKLHAEKIWTDGSKNALKLSSSPNSSPVEVLVVVLILVLSLSMESFKLCLHLSFYHL